MSRTEFRSKHFALTHTIEKKGYITKLRDNHYEDTCLITVVVNGQGMAFVEGSVYNVKSGDIVTSNDREIHCFKFEDTDIHERLSIYLSNSVFAELTDYNIMLSDIFNSHIPGTKNLFPNEKFNDDEVRKVIKQLCDIIKIENKTDSECARIHLLVLNLLLKMYDYFKKIMNAGDCANTHSLIFDICHYINENLTEELTYEKTEKRFFVSRYYLSEVFKKNTGMTFTEYIMIKRIKAVDIFVSEGVPLMLAAERAGFGNYSHFYKNFVKHRKISPNKYYEKRSIKNGKSRLLH